MAAAPALVGMATASDEVSARAAAGDSKKGNINAHNDLDFRRRWLR